VLRDFEARFAVGEVPPVPVERIATSLLDLLIEETDDVRARPAAPLGAGRLSGMIEPKSRTIWLDRRECARSPGRRRFTVAHECGHWVLHVAGSRDACSCRPADISDGDHGDDHNVRQMRTREAQANAFARELLMPELLVHEQARETGCNLSVLAKSFEVSVPAIRLRLLTLGLLPAWMRKAP
jgi:predicted transcriptional regulator